MPFSERQGQRGSDLLSCGSPSLMGMERSVARPADSIYLARLPSLDALDVPEGGLGRGHRLLPWEERPECWPRLFGHCWADDVYAKPAGKLGRSTASERLKTAVNHSPRRSHTD